MSQKAGKGRKDVWFKMAEHFLDTETRHEIPSTALACVEAGSSLEEAQTIWRYEVSPVLSANLWSVAGEWSGWDREWLEEEIDKCRSSGRYRPGLMGYLRYRIRIHLVHAYWVSIERCLEGLLRYNSYDEQRQVAEDLRRLAELYFDFVSFNLNSIDDVCRQRMQALYPDPFLRIFRPVVEGKGPMNEGNIRVHSGLMIETIRKGKSPVDQNPNR